MSYCRWDANGGPYKSRPHLLKGGFHNFVMHYPTEVVNPHTAREYVPKKRNNSTGVKVGFLPAAQRLSLIVLLFVGDTTFVTSW